MVKDNKEKWVAWDQSQTHIISCGHTRAEAKQKALETGETEPVLENTKRSRGLFAQCIAQNDDLREIRDVEGGSVAMEQVSDILGISIEEVEERRKVGSLIAVNVAQDGFRYPSWQFYEKGLLPGFEEIMRILNEKNIDTWMQLQFFVRRNYYVNCADPQSPIHALRGGNIDVVRRAAHCYLEQGCP